MVKYHSLGCSRRAGSVDDTQRVGVNQLPKIGENSGFVHLLCKIHPV